jgi:hypothetical protein
VSDQRTERDEVRVKTGKLHNGERNVSAVGVVL